jgi:pyruvate ferredoxin oxidoreductase beta subunit
VKIGRLAVETGIVVLFEIEHGKFRLTGRSRRMAEKGTRPAVDQFVERQGRFRKMSPEQLRQFQRAVDQKWNEYLRRAAE